MKDDAQYRRAVDGDVPEADVRHLARQAISVLASSSAVQNDGLARRLTGLSDAFISPDEDVRHDALLKLRQDGVTPQEIIDYVVPAAARLLGERWFADDISFVHVTIGAARLQETVRAMSARRPHVDVDHPAPKVPSILLIIPRSEQHTLGTFVLADQLRRKGYRVNVIVDQHPRQVAIELKSRHYSMIGISASGRRTLASTRELVDTIKSSIMRKTPIVLGGASLDQNLNVLEITGADYISHDANTALRMCGLPLTLVRPEPDDDTFGLAGVRPLSVRT